MKTNRAAIYVVLFSAVVTAISVLRLSPQVGKDPSGPAEISIELDTIARSGSIILDSRGDPPASRAGLESMSSALYIFEQAGEETDNYPALPPEATTIQDRMVSVGRLRQVELVIEANRIMEALCRDGLLTGPSSYDSAWAATSSHADKSKELVEQFRHMHQQHLALLPRALAYGDQDSLVMLGWSRIRFDVAKIHRMAAALRNETALAAQELTLSE